ncbi:hypothetical protein NC652_014074 [Populus alba x Populus x berolinensis]|nr:hypothetical protein NC652_014074 [Populus alba x Populus x berolinensis]
MEKKRRRKGLLTKKQKTYFYQKIVGLTTGKFSIRNSIMAEESKKIPQTNNNVRLFLQHPPII